MNMEKPTYKELHEHIQAMRLDGSLHVTEQRWEPTDEERAAADERRRGGPYDLSQTIAITPELEVTVRRALDRFKQDNLLHDERLMTVLLNWWLEGPVYDSDPNVSAIEDIQALFAHLRQNGYIIVEDPGPVGLVRPRLLHRLRGHRTVRVDEVATTDERMTTYTIVGAWCSCGDHRVFRGRGCPCCGSLVTGGPGGTLPLKPGKFCYDCACFMCPRVTGKPGTCLIERVK